MRKRYRTASKRGRDSGSVWMSYSDLMSALLLVFILVLFYSIFRYWEMFETKSAELEETFALLQRQKSELTISRESLDQALTDLDQKEDELEQGREELTNAERELAAQMMRAMAQETELAELQAKLKEQETALASARAEYDEQQEVLAGQQQQMAEQQVRIQKLVGVRAEIVAQLADELSRSSITGARVDDTGAIVFDSEMMFDKNMDLLKDQGKAFLDSFIPNYLSVLMSAENRIYVSQVFIEGHADTDGSFSTNMMLSQRRANAVLQYILSADFAGIDASMKEQLQAIVSVNGRSYNDPIYMPDGQSVDKDASRRVVIKFRLNDEEMVNEMAALFAGGG